MNVGLILIVVAFAFIYFALIRPQRRKQLTQAQMWQGLAEGDEIVTAGGIYGTVTGFDGDDLLVEIAPELVVKVARRAVAGTVPRDEADEEDAEPDEEEEGEDAEAEDLPQTSHADGESSATGDDGGYPGDSR